MKVLFCSSIALCLADAQSPEVISAPLTGEAMNARICLEATGNQSDGLFKMLSAADRPYVKVLAASGSCAPNLPIVVDMAHESRSMVFDAIKELNSGTSTILVISIRRPNQPFPCLIGVSRNGQEVTLVPCKEILRTENYVGARDGVPGQYLPPSNGHPLADVIYSIGAAARIFIATDQSNTQIAVTAAHEIVCHALRWVLGEEWRHPGVDKCVKPVESEAEGNASQSSESASS